LLAAEAEAHQDLIRAVLDVEPTGDFEVQTQAFILRKELVEDIAARGLHRKFELSHPRQCCQSFVESELRFFPDRSLALESGLLRQDSDASTPSDCNPTLRCNVHAGDDPEQRRFPGAVHANQGDVFPVGDLERNVPEYLVGAEILGEIVGCQYGGWRHGLAKGSFDRLERLLRQDTIRPRV
jgi:hypothetical protein